MRRDRVQRDRGQPVGWIRERWRRLPVLALVVLLVSCAGVVAFAVPGYLVAVLCAWPWFGAGLLLALLVGGLAPVPERVWSLVPKLSLAAATVFVTLLAAEGWMRFEVYRRDAHRLEDLERDLGPVQRPDDELALGEIIRPSPNERVIYELRPDSSYRFKGRAVRTNSRGFRCDEVAPGADDGIHVVGLGDSRMFGWGVEQHECFLAQLERKLGSELAGVPWHVINTGVPGYNTAMEVAVLREKGLAYRPDLVLIDFQFNDLHLPDFLTVRENHLRLDKSFLAELTKPRDKLYRAREAGLTPAPFDEETRTFVHDEERVPPRYLYMVGVPGYRQAMRELAALRDQYGFRVLVLSDKLPGYVEELAASLGFDSLSVAAAWKEHARVHGGRWRLSDGDPHPTPAAHGVIAGAIFDWGVGSGVFAELVQRRAAGSGK